MPVNQSKLLSFGRPRGNPARFISCQTLNLTATLGNGLELGLYPFRPFPQES